MFKIFKEAVEKQIQKMSTGELFFVDVSKDTMWELYLSSFPEGTNPMFRERTEHDCSCCRQFIKAFGNVVSIVDNKMVSIWDIDIDDETYRPVADTLSTMVKFSEIAGIYRSHEEKIGTDYNLEQVEGGDIQRWEHFHTKLSERYTLGKMHGIGEFNGHATANHDVFKRSMQEISAEACEIILELISQKSLYRGEEHVKTISSLLKYKKELSEYNNHFDPECKLFFWDKSAELKERGRFKNTVIGTLLSDISNGVELEDAVKMFESKVAPENYKRPTALITKGMISKAEDKVKELGLEGSLQRRYAVTEDITVNNVLFADRSVKSAMGGSVFDDLKSSVSDSAPDFDKVQEVPICKFIKDVLPTADSVELMIDNGHTGNLVSLIAPNEPLAPNILKWGNGFSWSYCGNTTDSIKERVKKAGGKVDAFLRTSLSWFNTDDLDIHAIEPNGNRIYFQNKRSPITGGCLDVDMNAAGRNSRDAVENITWGKNLLDGKYKIVVNNYQKRENCDFGFEIELEFDGKSTVFAYPKAVVNKENVEVVEFEYSKEKGVKIIKSIPLTRSSKEIWGIHTNKWNKVSMIMSSPNHWDGNETGNRHTFFVLEGCKNPDKARGLYNEFLRNDLTEHRKVFEMLGSKMKAEYSDNQLSGVGFSSTVDNSVLCKIVGKTNRIIKIKF